MTNAIIIEDEQEAKEVLKKMLCLIAPNIHIVGETGTTKQAIHLIKDLKPQLVFMDIELEDGTGFDILQQLRNIGFKIIFTTAYNQYAIRAFKFSAIDYLLKPIDPNELKEAISRALSSINEKEAYQELLSNINNEKEDQKIVLKTAEQRYILNIKEIIRLEADGAYTKFIAKEKKLIVSKNIKYYQDLLGDTFIRCHQSHLVNMKEIRSLDKNGALVLSNEDIVPVSQRNRSTVKIFLDKLI